MPRELRGIALSLLLFLAALLMGRLGTRDLASRYPTVGQSPSPTPTSLTPTRTPTPTHPPKPTPTPQLSGVITLDQNNVTAYQFPAGSFTHPLRMAVRGKDVYLLDTGQLKLLSLASVPLSHTIAPPGDAVDGVPIQELLDVSLSGDEASLLLLDRAGNVFRYSPDGETWQVERLVGMPGASERQHLISVCAHGDAWYVLDANVGQIWRHHDGQADIVPADTNLAESADFAVGQGIFVLTQGEDRGAVTVQKLSGLPLTPQDGFVPPSDLVDPSWLMADRAPAGYVYLIDMGYHRLRALDPETGSLVREYMFATQDPEMRSAYVDQETVYLASRDTLYVYPAGPVRWPMAEPAITPTTPLASPSPHDPAALELLPPLVLPIEGTALSNMAFRLPGAPRSYRYGVHEGIDFYSAAGRPVNRGTPVVAVAGGEVIRADVEYVAPSREEMEEIIARAQELYHTPANTLDVLRGRQVWIDHGKGVVTRYCHLDSVAEGLAVGQRVEPGQLIGYVGNSGTPASYYGQDLEMHLHLEIRIGDGYLGQFLRPVETKRWLEQAFAGAT